MIRKADLTTQRERWIIAHSKSIVNNFLSALYNMAELSYVCKSNDFNVDDIEFLANKNNLIARDLEIIFKHVEDLEDDLF